MRPDLALALERYRQARRTAADASARAGAAAGAATAARTAPLAPGTRVFDLQTGLEGTIIGGHSENVIVPNARRQDG